MEDKIFNECITRMELLKMSKDCIDAFKNGKVWESEGIGALYEVNDTEQKYINEFEEKNKGYRVYHIIHNLTDFGELYSLLYVGTSEDEWEDDKIDLKDGYAFVYVKNITDEFNSEFGSIMIKPNIGGLIRVY